MQKRIFAHSEDQLLKWRNIKSIYAGANSVLLALAYWMFAKLIISWSHKINHFSTRYITLIQIFFYHSQILGVVLMHETEAHPKLKLKLKLLKAKLIAPHIAAKVAVAKEVKAKTAIAAVKTVAAVSFHHNFACTTRLNRNPFLTQH